MNEGLLPKGYYAQSEQRAGQIWTDVITLSTEKNGSPAFVRGNGVVALADSPPKVSLRMVPDPIGSYRLARRSLVIRHASEHRVVALLEIVSPANKDRASSVEDFVDKALAALTHGCHLLLVDLFPPGTDDPQGMHGAIWWHYDSKGYQPPEGKPLTLAAYVAKPYVEPLAVGDLLPDMPLFLDPDWYVNTPLETTYQLAYRGVPEYWRAVIEGRNP
jgi:hypothetical protein